MIEKSKNKNLLVIGPGFLGAEIVKMAEAAGYHVSSASRSGADEFVDLADLNSLKALQKKNHYDYVIHCAASGRSSDRLKSYRTVYLEGCMNVVAAFPEAKILFTSSTSVYGQVDGSTVTEESLAAPATETGKILLQAEQVILENGGTVARLSGIYGHGRSYMLKRLFSGEAVIEGDGSRLLNHIHHRDAASACLFLLEQEKGLFNISDSTCLSQKETYERLSKQFQLPMPQVVPADEVTPSKRGYSDKCVSNEKLIALGWSPTYPCFADASEEIARSLGLIN